jgi:hypothetical protein
VIHPDETNGKHRCAINRVNALNYIRSGVQVLSILTKARFRNFFRKIILPIITLFIISLHTNTCLAKERKYVPGTNKYWYNDCSDMAPIINSESALNCIIKYLKYSQHHIGMFNAPDEKKMENEIDKKCCKIQRFFHKNQLVWSGYMVYFDKDGDERAFEGIFTMDGYIIEIYEESF